MCRIRTGWLYRRLEDVLVSASERPLQVLTHPGMWQDSPMPPRQRVERCIQGRAKATAEFYDNLLRVAGRPNFGADAVAAAVRGLSACADWPLLQLNSSRNNLVAGSGRSSWCLCLSCGWPVQRRQLREIVRIDENE